jgi:hypothetical protein
VVLWSLPNESEVDNVTHRAWPGAPRSTRFATTNPGKPILITENGTWSMRGYHGISTMGVADFAETRPRPVRRACAEAVSPRR